MAVLMNAWFSRRKFATEKPKHEILCGKEVYFSPSCLVFSVQNRNSPVEHKAMKVEACFRTRDCRSSFNSYGSLTKIWSKKSCGVIAEISHCSLSSTINSQLYRTRKGFWITKKLRSISKLTPLFQPAANLKEPCDGFVRRSDFFTLF